MERRRPVKRIYFAHPCFTDEQRKVKKAFLDGARKALENAGLEDEVAFIDPFDYMPDIEGDPTLKQNVARSIKEVCIRLLRESDVIVGLVDGEDSGVAFEVGVADIAMIPVVLVANRMEPGRINAMLLGAAAAVISDILRPGRMDFMLDIVLGLAVMERT